MAQGGLRVGLLAVLALAACQGPGATPPPAPSPSPQVAPTRPAPSPEESTPPATQPRASASPAPSSSADSCGAAALQYLVGKPRSDIPVPLTPSHRRVICSTCVVSQEFVPYRQTITYDTNTGLVTSVKCG